jgi:hypothetical protein
MLTLIACFLWQVGILFLQSLNHFQWYAYVRQAHARDTRQSKERPGQLHRSLPAPSLHTHILSSPCQPVHQRGEGRAPGYTCSGLLSFWSVEHISTGSNERKT